MKSRERGFSNLRGMLQLILSVGLISIMAVLLGLSLKPAALVIGSRNANADSNYRSDG